MSKPSTYTGFVDGGIIISCSADPEEILAMGVKPSRIVLVDGIRIAFEVTGNNLTNMIMCGAFAVRVCYLLRPRSKLYVKTCRPAL